MDTLAIVGGDRLRIYDVDGSAVSEIVNMVYLGPVDDPHHLAQLVAALRAIGEDSRPSVNGNGSRANGSAVKAPKAPKAAKAPKAKEFAPVPRTIDAVVTRAALLDSLSDWAHVGGHSRMMAKQLSLQGYAERRDDPSWTPGVSAGRQPHQYRITDKGRALRAELEEVISGKAS